jgi:LCP family protein required for cell wall assembly
MPGINIKLLAKYLAIIILTFLLLTLLVVTSFAFNYYHRFSSASGLTLGEMKSLLSAADIAHPQEFNLLILGLDSREASHTLLADTLILSLWRPSSNRAIFVSLPRDLWIDDLKTKINALYYYGQEQDPVNKTGLLNSQIELITGEKTDYYLILDFNNLADIVDLVSGIDIEVERSFDDYQFPQDDGSGETTYVSFTAGWQTMDGDRVSEYIRSRKSDDPEEGTDEARVARQQKAIMALVAKISQPEFLLKNPQVLGNLYRYWQEEIDTNLPISVLVNAGAAYGSQNMGLEFLSLPADYLFSPPIAKYGLWVWEPVDGSWEEINGWFDQLISQAN